MVVKASVVAARLLYPDVAFPDYFAAPDVEEAEAAAEARGEGVDYDFSGVQWESPSDGSDPLADLALFNSMGANARLTLDDDTEWAPEPMPDETADFEREWL